jgi:hypothetical protein
MKAFRRSLISWIALLGFVYAQLAVSSYACPLLNLPHEPIGVAAMADMAAGMPCAEMDMKKDADQTALCAQYRDRDKRTVGSSETPDLQPALVLFLTVPTRSHSEPAGETCLRAHVLARTTSPPPLWRTGRLRI